MVNRIASLFDGLRKKEQAKRSDVVVGITGTGRAILPLLKDAQLKPFSITITASGAEHQTEGTVSDWRIGKTDLIGGLMVAFQAERLKVARDLELAPAFTEELQNFKLRPPTLNENDPEAWRENPNDDLVFAAALANWRASKHRPNPQSTEARWAQLAEKNSESVGKWVV
jgi:hypothetical protein